MEFRRRTLKWLAYLLVLVQWGLALPLSLLFLNFDDSQLVWILLPFAWEVPLLGLLLVYTPARGRLQPLSDFLDSEQAPCDRDSLQRVRRLTTGLPLHAAVMVWGVCQILSLLAAAQMYHFGRLPFEEAAKVLVVGLPVGLLYSLQVYFLLASLLGPPLERCQAVLGSPLISGPRVPLFWKALACLVTVTVLAVSVMGLLSYTSTQRLLEANLAYSTQLRLAELSHAVATGQPWTHLLDLQGSQAVALLSRSGALVSYRGADASLPGLLADSERIRGDAGVRFLRTGQARLMAWKALPGDMVALTLVPLDVNSATLARELRSILVMAALTLAAALLLALVLARTLSRPVVALTALAARIPQEWPALPEARHSDDEIGTLSLAFQSMLNELKVREDDLIRTNRFLGQMIAERTLVMRDKEILLELSALLASTLEIEPLLEELLSRLQTDLHADGVAILLVEHHSLVVRAATGAARDLPRRRLPGNHPAVREALRQEAPVTLFRNRGGAEPILTSDDAMGSAVLVPMLVRDQALGLLCLYFQDERPLAPEVLALLRSIGSQAGMALRNASMFEEKSRATDLLRSVLKPSRELGFPGLEVGHIYIPSRELSGDYLDLIPLSDRRVAIAIADVAGKGSDAAIEAVRLKHTIHICAAAGYPPSLLVRLLNEQLHRTAEDLPRTITLFYGELDLDRGTLRFVSAGHEPPVFWHPGGGPASLLGSGGIVLGAIPDADYDEVEARLEPGDWIALYTDGITEARSPAGEMFGQERLLDLLASTRYQTADGLADQIDRAVHGFSQGDLSDDLSLLLLRCIDLPPGRRGPGEGPGPL